MSIGTHTLQGAFHHARLFDGKPLKKLREVQNFVLFKRGKALVDRLGSFNETSDYTHAPLLERGDWRDCFHLHRFFLLFLLLQFAVYLILEVLSLPGTDRAFVFIPLVVVDLRRGEGGDSRDSEFIGKARAGNGEIREDMVERKTC
jgi:hypothetical protein